MRKTGAGSALLLSCTIMFGCDRVSQADLPGTYVLSLENGTESLMVESNYQYLQVLRIDSDTNRYERRGKWKFDSTSSSLTLFDCIVGYELGRFRSDWQSEPSAYWKLDVHADGNEVRLTFDPDTEFAFEKKLGK